MGWFSEALAVLFGLDSEQREWREVVASAERYLQWGAQSRSAGDFEHVLDILGRCPDQSAPTVHFLYRRDRAALEAHLWLTRLALDNFVDQADKAASHFEAMEEGRRSLAAQIETARVNVARLEAEGSLISAREERRRLEEMEREARDLPDLNRDKRGRRAALFESCAPQIVEHREAGGRLLAALRALTGLIAEDQQARDRLCAQFDKALAAADADWKALAAQFPAAPAAPPAAPGAPARPPSAPRR